MNGILTAPRLGYICTVRATDLVESTKSDLSEIRVRRSGNGAAFIPSFHDFPLLIITPLLLHTLSITAPQLYDTSGQAAHHDILGV
jgi:hypothetical protein